MHQLQEISQGLREVFDEVKQYTNGLSQEALTQKPLPEKWSAGQNLLHLILSTKPLAKVMPLPKITFKTFGKPNRPGRSYEELVQRYKERLAESNPLRVEAINLLKKRLPPRKNSLPTGKRKGIN